MFIVNNRGTKGIFSLGRLCFFMVDFRKKVREECWFDNLFFSVRIEYISLDNYDG